MSEEELFYQTYCAACESEETVFQPLQKLGGFSRLYKGIGEALCLNHQELAAHDQMLLSHVDSSDLRWKVFLMLGYRTNEVSEFLPNNKSWFHRAGNGRVPNLNYEDTVAASALLELQLTSLWPIGPIPSFVPHRCWFQHPAVRKVTNVSEWFDDAYNRGQPFDFVCSYGEDPHLPFGLVWIHLEDFDQISLHLMDPLRLPTNDGDLFLRDIVSSKIATKTAIMTVASPFLSSGRVYRLCWSRNDFHSRARHYARIFSPRTLEFSVLSQSGYIGTVKHPLINAKDSLRLLRSSGIASSTTSYLEPTMMTLPWKTPADLVL